MSRTVLFLRHGQSEANAAGDTAADADASDPRWRDTPLTAHGRAQARAWRAAAAWLPDVEEVLVSPLLRAIETAALVFESASCSLRLTPYAREGWWDEPQNRGRLAAGLLAGTESGAAGEPRHWRRLSELPGHERLGGLDALRVPSAAWSPEAERSLTSAAALGLWRGSIARLCVEIAECSARVVCVVCHRGLIEALFGVVAPNCGVLRSRWWWEAGRLRREACGEVMSPPLGAARCPVWRPAWRPARALDALQRAAAPSVQALLDAGPEAGLEPGLAALAAWMAGDADGPSEALLGACEEVTRRGFAVLTAPSAHEGEGPLVPCWRKAFALAAALRGLEALRVGRGAEAARLLDLALLLGGQWPEDALAAVCGPALAAAAGQTGHLRDTVGPVREEGDDDDEEDVAAAAAEDEDVEGAADRKRRRLEPSSELPAVREHRLEHRAAAVEALRSARAAARGLKLHGAQSDWAATWAASIGALRRAHGHRTVPVEVGLRVWGERAQPGRQQRLMRLADFIDEIVSPGHEIVSPGHESGPAGARGGRGSLAQADASLGVPLAVTPVVPVTAAGCVGYVAQHLLFEQAPELIETIGTRALELAGDADPRGTVRRGRLWLGPEGTVTPLHYDHHQNVLFQLVGSKLVLLCEGRAGGREGGAEGGEGGDEGAAPFYPCDGVPNASRVDAELPDPIAHPRFAEVERRACVLRAGESLYIPRGVWHYARSLSASLSLSFWFE